MVKQKQSLKFIAGLAIGTLAFTACSESTADGEEEYSIGVLALDLQDPDLANMTSKMEEAAKEHGIKLEIADSKRDLSIELNQVEDMITRQVDAVIMQPIDGESSQNAAQRVIDAEIPLFVLSTEFVEGSEVAYESYIGVDDTFAGEMQGEYVNEVMTNGGDILFIAGTYGASWTDRRKQGFENTVDNSINIASEFQANGSRDEAKQIMEDTLLRYPSGSLNGVVAQNDEMAIGAASAIHAAGREDEFEVLIGIDGTDPALTALSAGELTATVLQDSEGQGVKAVEVVTDFLDGKDVEDRYHLPFELITESNVEEFIN